MLIALAGQMWEQRIVQGLVLCCVPGTEILGAAGAMKWVYLLPTRSVLGHKKRKSPRCKTLPAAYVFGIWHWGHLEQEADQNRLGSAPSVSGFCLASWLCLLLGALCSSLPLSADAQQETGKLLFLQWTSLGRSLSWESSGQKQPGVAKTIWTDQAGIWIFKLSLVFIPSPPSMAAPGWDIRSNKLNMKIIIQQVMVILVNSLKG